MNLKDTSSLDYFKELKLQLELPDPRKPAPEVDPLPPADGGVRAWLTLFGAESRWLTVAATFGYTNAFGVYQDLYTREHTASATRVSWIGSTQLFLIIAAGLPAGKLHDMGYFRHVVLTGSVIYTLSLFLLSFADPEKYYQLFLSQGLGMGIGAGLVYIPCLAVQAEHWRVRRSLALGAVTTGVAVGGIVFPIMLNQLFHSSVGYAWGIRASAFLVMGMLAVSNCLMTSYPRRHASEDSSTDFGALLKDVPYMLLSVAGLFIIWGLYFPFFYIQLYAILHGMDPTFAFYTLAILNAASVPGRIVPNLMTGRVGPINLGLIASVGCAGLTFALFGVTSVAGIVVFAILYGFFSGAFLSMFSPAITMMSKNERELGIRLGFASTLSSIGALTGTPIDGALLGATFPWSKPISFNGLLAKQRGTQIV
ncbi:MFS general substrate transporter [Artomyces pyxidatus]|uniref:MFS general substrate transporter n=1 Tax=Artomyces pyxidatus TaxID=48021 RepID=A0ACB8SKX8_9AGAM|nr:MFS general substrate transporter [Artomyces pyxidatus]